MRRPLLALIIVLTVSAAPFLSLFLIATPPARATDAPFTFRQVKPDLQIDIPTLRFSDVRARTIDGEPTDVSIPWIGEYIAAIYRWAVPVGAILATVVIMAAGVIWLTSGGAGTLSTAKEWITNAVIGLLLLVGSYVVLNVVNPDLVRLQALQIKLVPPSPLIATTNAEDEEEVPTGAPFTPTYVSVRSEHTANTMRVEQHLAQTVLNVAQELYNETANIPGGPYKLAGGGWRPLDGADWSQVEKWARQCEGKPQCGTPAVCNPFPPNMLDANKRRLPGATPDARRCPHTSGVALDYGCKEVNTDRFFAPCQLKLEEIMLRKGFCRLRHEPWHFELPKLTPGCGSFRGNFQNRSGSGDYSSCTGIYTISKKECQP
ncbi:hypothetical protein HY635_02975 [Candidatus Uhrbacteria bacterium]|nr:hypothetical protein [Candidatus Uhrbacteria bacterium]